MPKQWKRFIQIEAIKAVIITGAGNKAFVAGADISEFIKKNEEAGEALARHGQIIFSKMENCPKPIIAAVNGFALGAAANWQWLAILLLLPVMLSLVSRKLI